MGLTRSHCPRHGEPGKSGSEGGIFGNRLLIKADTLVDPGQALPQRQRAGVKVQIVGFGARLIAAAAQPDLQPQAVDDATEISSWIAKTSVNSRSNSILARISGEHVQWSAGRNCARTSWVE